MCSHSNTSSLLCKFVFDENLTQISEKKKGNTLDLIFTNNNDNIQYVDVCPDKWKSTKSDFFLIEVSITSTVTHQHPNPTKLRDNILIFKNADLQGLHDYLLDFDFSHCFQSKDVEFIWSELKRILSVSMVSFIPKVKLHPVNRPKWLTPNVRHQIIKCKSMKIRLG